jgi:CRISPR-associated protein Csd2
MADFSICGDPNRRHDFIMLFDVTDGNPNGDPDAGNMPRVDPETNQGLVTDVCLKRKVRNFVTLTKEGSKGYEIYVNDQGVALNTLHQDAYNEEPAIKSTGTKQKREDIETARDRMCRRFYDVRTFGAVMTTGVNAGQVRGPVQLTFARSLDPIVPLEVSITRVAITKPEDAQFAVGEDGKEGKRKVTEMGNKAIVPYGLYVGHGFFSAPFAKQTGVSREDLELFWSALVNMWDLDHSASRGRMACQGLYVFSHDNALGNAPAHKLFSRLATRPREGVESPRRYEDYVVTLNGHELPEGVTLTRLVDGV